MAGRDRTSSLPSIKKKGRKAYAGGTHYYQCHVRGTHHGVPERMRSTSRAQKTTGHWRGRWTSVVLQFVILFAFWLILSGHYQAKYIVIGVISAGLVTLLTNDILYSMLRYGERGEPRIRSVFLQLLRFIAYLPWLLSRIIMANVQVAYLILHPKMPIDPVLFLFRLISLLEMLLELRDPDNYPQFVSHLVACSVGIRGQCPRTAAPRCPKARPLGARCV